MGATGRQIWAQILGELVTMSVLGVGAALVVLLQAGLFDLLPPSAPSVYPAAAVAAAAVVLLLALLCALYPGRLATTVRPAEALHWE